MYHLPPFLLSNVAVSSSCHLSEFVFNMASFINSNESFFLYDCVLCPPFLQKSFSLGIDPDRLRDGGGGSECKMEWLGMAPIEQALIRAGEVEGWRLEGDWGEVAPWV